MSEKFQKVVNAPHKFAGRVRKNISQLQPKTDSGKVAQSLGILTAGMTQFLLWLGTKITLDNKLTQAGEKYLSKIKPTENPKRKNIRVLQSKIKQHSNLSAHLAYYALLGALAFGAIHEAQGSEKTDEQKQEQVVEPKQEKQSYEQIIKSLEISPAGTYSEFKNQCKPITPLLVGFMSCPEGFREDVYKDGRGKLTIGYGSTIIPDSLGNPVPISRKTKSVSREQAYEYARWHIEDYETDLILYCYCVALNKTLNASEYLGFASFLYNGGGKNV